MQFCPLCCFVPSETRQEIDDCLKEADSCLQLIIPAPLDFDVQGASVSSETLQTNPLKQLQSKISVSSGSTSATKNQTVTNFEDNKHVAGFKNEPIDEKTNRCVSGTYYTNSNGLAGNIKIENSISNSGDDELNKTCEISELSGLLKVPSYSYQCAETDIFQSEEKDEDGKDIPVCVAATDDVDDDQDDDDEEKEDNEREEEKDNDLQVHGLHRPDFNLSIEISADDLRLKETEDNTDIMQSLKDASKLIGSSYLPKVTKWLEVSSL